MPNDPDFLAQDEASLTKNSRRSLVLVPRAKRPRFLGLALDKNPMPGHLFEGNPVGEGTKRRGTDTPMHLLETPAGSTPTPVLLPGKSHGWRSLVGCRLWGRTESDTTEVT